MIKMNKVKKFFFTMMINILTKLYKKFLFYCNFPQIQNRVNSEIMPILRKGLVRDNINNNQWRACHAYEK